ncbi:flagellin N-terminal helical domain-containing protein [Senegalia sp. (in: firmicutes)]|uniref:flagellin N-terminal helical domain-containing protein n=1 Tax=Senegalia sp. (in: firmicutes) TaxID=1924098 RepID=UPI003F9E670F
MRINHNLMAMNTHRQLGVNSANSEKNVGKLSSGLRINKAGDDAAGLAISEKMRGQIRGLNQASRNAQDGISMIQTAEGALNETHAILQRMRELTVQSNNDTNTSEDLNAIQEEITQLTTEVTDIATRTEFNGKTLLKGTVGLKLDAADNGDADTVLTGHTVDVSAADAGKTYTFSYTDKNTTISLSDGTTSQTVNLSGAIGAYSAGDVLDFDKLGVKVTLGSADTFNSTTGIDINDKTLITEDDSTVAGKSTLQIGANSSQTLDISMSDMRATNLGSTATPSFALDGVDVTSQRFTDNLAVIDQSIKDVSAERSKLGAYQNRLDHTIKNLDTSGENLQAAESRIRDVDMAKEMMEFTKNNILSQAAQSMLSQANSAPQGVLQLLR